MRLHRLVTIVTFLFLLFGADAALKAYVHNNIPEMGRSHPFFPFGGIAVFSDIAGIDFCIDHVKNKGAAWGLFAKWDSLLIYARLILVACLITYTLFFNAKKFRDVPFGLIIVGAIGNIVDYFMYGHVIDMFHFRFFGHSFAVFNVADSAIFLGVVSLLLISFSQERKLDKSADYEN